jgi:hypothetical protein
MSSILDNNYREFNFEDSRESKSNQSDNNSVKLSSSKLRKKWLWIPFLYFCNIEKANEHLESDDFKQQWPFFQ